MIWALCGLGLLACKSKEEILNAAEAEGQLLAEKKARLAKGVGEGLQGEGKSASESVLKGVAQVVRGGVSGAVEGATDLPISAGPALTEAGLKAERAAIFEDTPAGEDAGARRHSIKVYLIFDKPFAGALNLIGRDTQGREAGRAKVEVAEKEPTGKYVVFAFDPLVDLSTMAQLELR